MCVICSHSKYVLIDVMHICVVDVIVEVYTLFNKMPPCMKYTYMGGCVCVLIEVKSRILSKSRQHYCFVLFELSKCLISW
jgi:hypothetical protein